MQLIPKRDGTWAWRYRAGGLERNSSTTYPTAEEATRAARTAYPYIPVSVAGERPSWESARGPMLRKLSVPALVRRLIHEASSLVEEGGELARAEIRESVRKAGVASALLALAGLLALLAAGSITACLILALSSVVAAWLAALIVAIAYVIAGTIFGVAGIRSARKTSPVMPRTTESMKETVGWAMDRMSSDERSRPRATS